MNPTIRMTYTVKQLARLASISVRTLHYYDEIRLLTPPVIGANGYRYYDDRSLLRLQSILFYRELDFPLDAIKAALDRPDFDAIRALREQRAALEAKQGQLHRVIVTIDQTLRHLQGEPILQPKELFQGLTPEQEDANTHEAAQRWDSATVQASQRKWKRYNPARRQEILDEGNAGMRALVAAMPLGPSSAAVQVCIERWRQHINHFWSPTDEQCLGLALVYRDDPAFRKNFDEIHPDLAPFIVEAVKIYVAGRCGPPASA